MNWDGKKVILEMKENEGRNWRQMEWIGWYFEYWCNRNLKSVMQMPCSKKYGKVEFDANYALAPYYIVYVAENGDMVFNHLQGKKSLDIFKKLCAITRLRSSTIQ